MKKKKNKKRAFWHISEKAKRPFNEDSLIIHQNIFAIADGHGQTKGQTQNAGSIASQTTLEYFKEKFLESQINDWSLKNFKEFFIHYSPELKKILYNECRQFEPPIYSGTTLEFVYIGKDNILIAHVGDSRIYIVTKDFKFQQITKDENVATQLIESGKLDEKTAKVWSQNFVLTNSISFEQININFIHELNRKDVRFLLIATDGLTDKLLDKEICDCIIKNNYDPKAVVHSLVKMAENPSFELFKIYVEYTDEIFHLFEWTTSAYKENIIDESILDKVAGHAAIALYNSLIATDIKSREELVNYLDFLYFTFSDSDLATYIIYRCLSDAGMDRWLDLKIDDSINNNIENLERHFEILKNSNKIDCRETIIEAIEENNDLSTYFYNSFVNYFGGNDNISIIVIDLNKLD